MQLSEANPARVLIVDDHHLVRAGLREMLSTARDLAVVGEAGSGVEALELCRLLTPNLVLMDVRMPIMDGVAATRAIRSGYPGIAVLILTVFSDPDVLLAALQAGAAAYLLKDATQPHLISTIYRVLRREFLIDRSVMGRLVETGDFQRYGVHSNTPYERLTAREITVLRLLARGQTNREIAHDLGVSVGTVKVHVERIIAKLGAADRTHAAVRAVELGLLPNQQ